MTPYAVRHYGDETAVEPRGCWQLPYGGTGEVMTLRGWRVWIFRQNLSADGWAIFESDDDAYLFWQETRAALSDRSGLAPDGSPRKAWIGTISDILEGRFVEPLHEVKSPAWSTYNGIFTDVWGTYSPKWRAQS